MISKSWQENNISLADEERISGIENFMRWPTIRKTIICEGGEIINTEYDYIKYSRFNLEDNKTGNPQFIKENITATSVHSAYHFHRYEQSTKKKINDYKTIFEFGGGFGNACKVIKKSGFKGEYIIFDLPCMQRIQEYYLDTHEIKPLYVKDIHTEIIWKEPSLFLSTWAISEAPEDMIDFMMPVIKNASGILIAYADCFDGIDNNTWINKNFPHDKIEPIKHFGHSKYLFR